MNKTIDIHESINYLEFPAKDLKATKTFFSAVFGWLFVDYGAEYVAFTDKTIEGGFYKSDLVSDSSKGAVLVVFYSENLEETQRKIVENNGTISKEIFSFPGGRRFHFLDINGNEFSVWTKEKGVIGVKS